ncbi:MAG TPA: TlpA disulfide reductase family protein [Terracidiphilus sp.]|nr:TlpA disulfide reductase family protein [Terracidiphilus sp.]
MKRNTIVLGITLFLLATFAWAGWANWEYRKQAAEKRAAMEAARAELIPAAGSGDLSYSVSPLLQKPAPQFKLPDVSGKKVSLDSYRGKALLINFWATWCAPCKIETPWLVELRNQYAPQGFEIIGISSEADDLKDDDKEGWAHDRAAIQEFVQKEHIDYPILMNGDSITKPYGGVDDLPTSFFLDRKGKVVAAQVGLTSKDDIESKIKKALASN